MNRITLQSIADQLGVSRMTVSNAFSRPDQLSPSLRERILATADELGYTGPDPSARCLKRGTSGTIGVLWSGRLRYSLSDEVSARFLGAIADELAPDGLALTLLPARVDDTVVAARDVAMDGAIAYTCPSDLPALGLLEHRRLPLVYVDMPGRPGGAGISIDDRGGARQAAQHLLDLGHRKIAIISAGLGSTPGPVALEAAAVSYQIQPITQRLLGWQDALQPAGVQAMLVAQPNPFEDARPAARAMLADPHQRPTGVLCFTDVIAHDVISVADELGLRVPDDLSVIGFDDHPLAVRSCPPLTTVRQDVDAKGRAAARALRQAIAHRADPSSPAPLSQMLDVELIVRDSTSRPPG